MEITAATLQFIRAHADGDVRQLAFLASAHPDVDLPFALNQIAGRQMAREKLPAWAATEGMIYPPHLSMEQCSSQSTALYKARLVQRLLGEPCGNACPQDQKISAKQEKTEEKDASASSVFVDLTGGFGVDFSFLARAFDAAVYVERQSGLCEIARHNFPLLGLHHANVVCAEAETYLHTMSQADIVFLDPARRDAQGGKTVLIHHCTPNLCALLDTLMVKARWVVVKLSPMLHWQAAVETLQLQGAWVRQVHIVSVRNECKELLFVLSAPPSSPLAEGETTSPQVVCVNDDAAFAYRFPDESTAPQRLFRGILSAGMYLYEPHSSLMKAGCFGLLTARWPVEALAANSHLFVSTDEVADFPGRRFQLLALSSFNKKELKNALLGLRQAHIATRNFPLGAEALRKRLKIKDGGDSYLFATTDVQNHHWLLVCRKIPTT